MKKSFLIIVIFTSFNLSAQDPILELLGNTYWEFSYDNATKQYKPKKLHEEAMLIKIHANVKGLAAEVISSNLNLDLKFEGLLQVPNDRYGQKEQPEFSFHCSSQDKEYEITVYKYDEKTFLMFLEGENALYQMYGFNTRN